MAKLGTNKKPAILRVQTEARMKEMAAICEKHGWKFIIGIEPDKPENISDLQRLLQSSKPITVRISKNSIGKVKCRSPLNRLFPDSPETTSPLANVCLQLDVGPFPPNVARAFLKHRLRGTGITFTQSQIDDLMKRTNGHPGKLQDEAAKLYRELSRIERG